MTHKSLFKEAAQRFVQRGQLSDTVPQPVGQVMASQPASSSHTSEAQMDARTLRSSSGSLMKASAIRTDR
jgi:hypothetical protein